MEQDGQLRAVGVSPTSHNLYPLQDRLIQGEPLRLQIVVEASTEVLTAIYQRQPSLRELIGGDWVHVIAKDPDSGEFSIFDPARGFVPWAGPSRPLPERARSGDWYRGHTDPLSPALIGEGEI